MIEREEKLGAIDFKDPVKLLQGGLGQREPGFESGFVATLVGGESGCVCVCIHMPSYIIT